PRAQQAKLEGAARRANAAHNNSFEAFAPFAAAVLACEVRGANARWVEILAIAFVVLRTLYILAYVGAKPSTPPSIWRFGFLCGLGLFARAVIAGLGKEPRLEDANARVELAVLLARDVAEVVQARDRLIEPRHGLIEPRHGLIEPRVGLIEPLVRLIESL